MQNQIKIKIKNTNQKKKHLTKKLAKAERRKLEKSNRNQKNGR